MPAKLKLAPLPAALNSKLEVNPWLRKFKAAREDKWSLGSAKSVWELSDLGFYLRSLGRTEDALGVVTVAAEGMQLDTLIASDLASANVCCREAQIKWLMELGHAELASSWFPKLRNYNWTVKQTGPNARLSFDWKINEDTTRFIRETRSGERSGPSARLGIVTGLRYVAGYWSFKTAGVEGCEWIDLGKLEGLYQELLELLNANLKPLK